MSYALIIPVYNEEKSLKKLIPQLKRLNQKIEVVIINDGSTDNTKSILRESNDFKIINNAKNKGKGYSIIKGVKAAENDNIILMDGDLEIDLMSVLGHVSKYELRSKQVIVGSRWNENSNIGSSINTYGNYFFNYLFNIIYRTRVKDVLCCVKILDKNLFNSLDLNSSGFSIEIELMAKLAINKAKFFNVEVFYNRRTVSDGKKLKISDGWNILCKMLEIKIKGN